MAEFLRRFNQVSFVFTEFYRVVLGFSQEKEGPAGAAEAKAADDDADADADEEEKELALVEQQVQELEDERARELKRKKKKVTKERRTLQEKMRLKMVVAGDAGPGIQEKTLFGLKQIKTAKVLTSFELRRSPFTKLPSFFFFWLSLRNGCWGC